MLRIPSGPPRARAAPAGAGCRGFAPRPRAAAPGSRLPGPPGPPPPPPLHAPPSPRAARAGVATERTRPGALAAATAEDHAAAMGAHRARARAPRAGHGTDGPRTRSAAGVAAVESDDVEAAPRRMEGLVEGDADRFLQVLTAVGPFARGRLAARGARGAGPETGPVRRVLARPMRPLHTVLR